MPVPVAERARGEAMGVRVVRTAQELGVGSSDLDRLDRVHRAAMQVRNAVLDDDHDPAYLHPGRSALILLQDVEETDPTVLAAAMVVDSQRPAWAPGDAQVDDPAVCALRDQVPPSGSEELAERLVTADTMVRRVALAERLDHLRHAHLWPDMDARRRAHEEAVAVYTPIADRTDPVLSRRLHWWCRMFGARHVR